MPDFMGPAQIAALLILAQRGVEELHSRANTRRLLAEGAHEEGASFYPVVAVAHLAWIASIALLIPPDRAPIWLLGGLYLALQIVRYWVIGTLGRYWTHRIITVPGAPIEQRGPYRVVRHPNYAVTITETFLLPLVFGSIALALIMGALWWAVIRYKIVLEDDALAARRAQSGT